MQQPAQAVVEGGEVLTTVLDAGGNPRVGDLVVRQGLLAQLLPQSRPLMAACSQLGAWACAGQARAAVW
jgi:hypothetical protein